MSTKTTFKRVALVAAAALTFAGISGVAAHATATAAAFQAPTIGVLSSPAATATTASAVELKYTTVSGNGYASNVAIGLYKVYMPYTGGKVTITATGGTALPAAAQVAVTASADVTDSGASALAAVTALASQVSALQSKLADVNQRLQAMKAQREERKAEKNAQTNNNANDNTTDTGRSATTANNSGVTNTNQSSQGSATQSAGSGGGRRL